MGSGKSFYASKLAEKKQLAYIDLDQYIEEQEGASIAQIFENKGEVYFRKIESKYLTELLKSKKDAVFALGGGTPCYADNLDQINSNQDCISVYLQKSVLDISKHLYTEKSKRPLIAHFSNEEDFVEYISKHLFERQAFYLQADHKINLSQAESDKEVLKQLTDIWDTNHY